MGECSHADDIDTEYRILREHCLIDPPGQLDGDTVPQAGAFHAGKGFLYLTGGHVVEQDDICPFLCSSQGILKCFYLYLNLPVSRYSLC